MIWILVSILLVSLFYWKCVKPMYYWKEKGIEQGKSVWIVGDNWSILTKKHSFAEMIVNLYNLFPKSRYSGMYQFNIPTLMIRDPDLIRQITVKDFDHFVDHRTFIPEDADPLWANNLFSLTGDKWRHMRATLSPAFTSSKMKAMYVLMTECGDRFVDHFIKKAGDGKEIVVEMKDAFTRYTNDVIASTAFGITCDSLEEQNNEFFLMGKEATDFKSFWKNIKFMLLLFSPILGKTLGVRIFSKDVHNFFTRVVKETIEAREKHGIVRPDMIHLLLEARKGHLEQDETELNKQHDVEFSVVQESDVGKAKHNHKREITDLDITAQALIFFFAGFETVSTLMCFLTYELAINPDIQARLYEEIKNTGGNVNYEVLQKMKYLDMVVSETLRKWPPGVAVDRVCVKPYTIESQLPHEKSLHFKINDLIWLPIYALHHDEKYYPNPEKFDPERFSDENKQNIVPYTYLPFGSGPRNCIGSRFALLETKAVICSLLSKFEITVVDKTPIPLRICKTQFNLGSEDGFWVGLKPRK